MQNIFGRILNNSNDKITFNSGEHDQLIRSIMNFMPDLIVIKDDRGCWINANDFTRELFEINDFIGKTTLEISRNVNPIYRDILEKWNISDDEVWNYGKPINLRDVVAHPKRESTILDVLKIPVFDSEGQPNILVIIGRDITQEVRIENQLRLHEQRFQKLSQESIDVFVISDENGIIQYVSNASEHVLGHKPDHKIGKSIYEYVHEEELGYIEHVFSQVVTNPMKIAHAEVRLHNSDESWVICEVVMRNLLNEPSVQGIVINYRDITDKKQAQKTIQHMAYHDSLTDLYNRRYLEEKLNHYISNPNLIHDQFAILYCDLDRFKFVNDTLGHTMGDRLLIEVAKRVNQCLREQDIFARFGGDEFVLLLPNVNPNDAFEVAKHILHQIKTPFFIDNYELLITGSIGICHYPDDGVDVETLMKHADIALHRAKEHGKNQIQIFTPNMNVQTYMTFKMQHDLRKAIEKNQMEIFYQPRVDPRTNKIVSAEALLRWKHPEWGVVLPKDFIPIAEETDLINELGHWVLENVCNQNRKWQELGLTHIPLSVNVSGKQFMQRDFANTILQTLKNTGLDPEWLELEITETMMIENSEAVNHSTRLLRNMGVKIALDDFGTGYSSFGRLKEFQIDTIKIDQSFLKGIETDKVNAEITRSVIGLAHGLGQTAVAEGVESKNQLLILKNENCDQIQGYYYSPPVDANSFGELLKNEIIKDHTNTDIYINKRRYYRQTLEYNLSGQMTVSSINGKSIDIGYTNVLIEDIGAGGLRFLSNIRLPINENMILHMEMHIFEDLRFIGHIVWMNEFDENIQEYGFKFILTESEEQTLIQIVNRLTIQMRKNPIVQDCDFYLGSITAFFKNEE